MMLGKSFAGRSRSSTADKRCAGWPQVYRDSVGPAFDNPAHQLRHRPRRYALFFCFFHNLKALP
jgi:hypothetical protein